MIGLLQSGLSGPEIRAIIPVGSPKIQRLQKVLKHEFETLHRRRAPNVPHHAHANADVQAIKVDAETWEVEDGFSCSYRRPKQYLLELQIT